MPINDQLTELRNALVRKQWLAIKDHTVNIAEGLDKRMDEYRQYGTHTMQVIVADAGVTTEDFGRCTMALKADPRLSFLLRLPAIAAMGGAFGDAVEKSFFNSSSGTFRETTALVGMFTRILDSLIDDAPDLIGEEHVPLLTLLNKKSWEESVLFPSDDELLAKHPAVSLLYKFTRECVGRIKRSEYWKSNASLPIREIFSSTAENSLESEYQTIGCEIKGNSDAYDPQILSIVQEKSQDMMMVMALAPITHFGWPPHVDIAAYETSIKRLGNLFGWIDDIGDVHDDLEDGNWSEVLIELYENAQKPPYSSKDQLDEMICTWLRDDKIVDHLVSKGLNLYSEALSGFEGIGIDPLPLQQYTTDAILSWISPKE